MEETIYIYIKQYWLRYLLSILYSVADPNPLDPDSAFHLDPDPTFLYGSGSLPFQRGNIPKTVGTVLLSHINLIFLACISNRTQPDGILCYIFPSS
jgi:hypothetical protein